MASDLEPVPVTSQKHDPAWKHCQMYKNGDRVMLRCLYCGKMFKGGGIHRIKEHLAGQKGNASTCLRVQPDVRLLMQESLNGVVMKKRKKQKLAEEMSGYKAVEGNGLSENSCGLNTEVGLALEMDTLEQDTVLGNREEDATERVGGRKKKGTTRKTSASGARGSLPLNMIQVNNSKKVDNQVHVAIGRFLFDINAAPDAVKSVYFQPMIDAIASQGTEVAGPSYHDVRGWILKSSAQEVRNNVDECMGTWASSGCSVLVDEWVSEKGKTLLNFMVYCPEGTMFLRSVDVSGIVESADSLYELLKEIVEEVGVRNVLQVITKAEEYYATAGKKLIDAYPTIFWTPCASCCVDLMLEDIRKLDWINSILEQSKSISRFIYNHNFVLNMMRRYTFGVDLIDLGDTPIMTDFLTLQRMVNIKHNLQSMFTSEEWVESPYSKKQEGFTVLDYVSSQSFWSDCTLVTRLADPLLRLSRIVNSEKSPGMGYVYAGLYRAKETFKRELASVKDYLPYWNIIDRRWEQLQRHPLHAAGFYLNPKFFYNTECDENLPIRSLVYDCVEKLVPDTKIQDKIVKEITCYHNGAGDFGRKMAIRARDNTHPAEWWSHYGLGCPNLARLAIRILSQTCSLIRFRQNQIPFDQFHENKNCLEHQRLSDLIYAQCNMMLRQRHKKNKEHDLVDPTSYDNIGLVEDWIKDKELSTEDHASSDWMIVDPPLGNIALLGPQVDDVEALGAVFDDHEIFNGVKDGEEENGDDNIVS